MISLSDLMPGDVCKIEEIKTTGEIRTRFQDIGLIKKTKVKCTGMSFDGNLKSYLIRGAVIAIRNDDCSDIFVKKNN